MEKYIWYNPVLNIYEAGSIDELEDLQDSVEDKDSIVVIYKLSKLSSRLATKLLTELNIERQSIKQAV